MARVFDLDDPADQRAAIREAMLQSLLYGNLYLTREGQDVTVWDFSDLKPRQDP